MTGERRQLTVLFCDLFGSTGIATRLDPEQWGETVAGYHRTAAEAITRFDGHVAKYLGDGVMAYFGWPAAHANDAERAARAGRALLDAIAKLSERPYANLSARVGIDSGTVVIGKGAEYEAALLGDTPQYCGANSGSGGTGNVIGFRSHAVVPNRAPTPDLPSHHKPSCSVIFADTAHGALTAKHKLIYYGTLFLNLRSSSVNHRVVNHRIVSTSWRVDGEQFTYNSGKPPSASLRKRRRFSLKTQRISRRATATSSECSQIRNGRQGP